MSLVLLSSDEIDGAMHALCQFLGCFVTIESGTDAGMSLRDGLEGDLWHFNEHSLPTFDMERMALSSYLPTYI